MDLDFSVFDKEKKKQLKYLSISFTPEQWDKIEKYSQKEGYKKSRFTRQLISVALSGYEEYISSKEVKTKKQK